MTTNRERAERIYFDSLEGTLCAAIEAALNEENKRGRLMGAIEELERTLQLFPMAVGIDWRLKERINQLKAELAELEKR